MSQYLGKKNRVVSIWATGGRVDKVSFFACDLHQGGQCPTSLGTWVFLKLFSPRPTTVNVSVSDDGTEVPDSMNRHADVLSTNKGRTYDTSC